MTKENVIQSLERYFPEEGEDYLENGVLGERKFVRGIKRTDLFAGKYAVQKIVFRSPGGLSERHEIYYRNAMSGEIKSAVLVNGEVMDVQGFGKKLSQPEMQLYVRTLFHHFTQSEEFIPPLKDAE